MPEVVPQPKNPTFHCPSCNARGQVRARPCQTCHGHGLYYWLNSRLLFWGKDISRKDIWQARINKSIKITFFIAIFAVAFWGLYSLFTFTIEAIELKFFREAFVSVKDPRLLIFWISFWVDLYLLYRISKSTIKHQVLKPPNQKSSIPEPLSWEEALAVPGKLRYDISPTFTPEAQSATLKAWEVAKNLSHREVEPLHLLAASLTLNKTANIFGRLGIPLKKINEKIIAAATSFYADAKSKSDPHLSPNLKQIFFMAYAKAQKKEKKQVDIFDLLISINNSETPAREVLYALDVEKDELRNAVLWVETVHELARAQREFGFLSQFKPSSGMNRSMTASATPILNRFGSDLTMLAQKGYLSPCVARDEELAQIFQVSEARKMGVLLVGNPGTGRATIVSGVARRMVAEKVPKVLEDKRLVKLNLPALVAGAQGSGSVEERMSIALNEIIHSGNVALFVSDIHNLIGVRTTTGELDASEILSSAITRGRFFLIATTNPLDYHKYIEGTALDEVMEKIKVNEPKGNALIQILETATLPLEAKYKVFYSYDSIAQAAKLSDRYLHEKYLPEKAINLLESAALLVKKERGGSTIIQKEDIARVLSNKTKIPLTQITEEESAKLMHLEERIHEKMIDQDPAVDAVSNALRRARAQLRDSGRPIANFLFLGPTGVGKTQLAKVVANVYFGSSRNMIRIDMSEFQDQASIPRLIGFAGDKTRGLLTEPVRQNPFSLILLDELEKAHPEILNLFLQVMDDGRITDGYGRVIDFTNSIIIATSNAGAQYIFDAIRKDTPYDDIKNNLIENQLKSSYRPEFLNRFDEIIVFKPLTQADLNQIAILLLADVVNQMQSKGIKLEFTEGAVVELAKEGYDPQFGARPLRRVIQEKVTNALAEYVIQGQVDRRDTIIYDIGGKISVKKARHL